MRRNARAVLKALPRFAKFFQSGVFRHLFVRIIRQFRKIAKHGGAGTLVPVTGFSNAITAPALEAKTEGYILGVGAKIFTIAGPVILYGTLSSIVCGLIYFFIK